MTTVNVDANGAIELPEAVLQECQIKPGTQLVVIAREGRIVLMDRERFRRQVEVPAQQLLERFREAIAQDPEAPFIDGVTFDEYAGLAEEEEQALWDRLSAEAAQSASSVERDIPAHFRSARQERR